MMSKRRASRKIEHLDAQGAGSAARAEPSLTIPDGMSSESAIGWRAWRVVRTFDGQARLVGPIIAAPWATGGQWTEGLLCVQCSEARNEDCHCGINAFADQELLAASSLGREMVIGEIELSGQVVQYESGWRGQLARPKRLIVRPLHADQAQQAELLAAELSEVYACDVSVAAELGPTAAQVEQHRFLHLLWRMAPAAALLSVVVWCSHAYVRSQALLHEHAATGLAAPMPSVAVLALIFWPVALPVIAAAKRVVLRRRSMLGLGFEAWTAMAVMLLVGVAAAFPVSLVVIGAAGQLRTSTPSYREATKHVAKSGKPLTLHATSRSSIALADAVDVRPDSCKTILIDKPRNKIRAHVRVCRQGRAIRMTRVQPSNK